MIDTISNLKAMVDNGEALSLQLKKVAFRPRERKRLELTFGPGRAADLIGRTPEAIAKAEAKGRLPQPKIGSNGRRYYTLEDLTLIRQALGIIPGKQAHEAAVVLAVQNFKGGVGKSTITKHLADFLALQGLRVLVVDCDPQASTSSLFDVDQEELWDSEETLAHFLAPTAPLSDFRQTIRDTAWPTTKIVPSSLGLGEIEWHMVAGAEGRQEIMRRFGLLRSGISQVRREFDVILLDPPPAMGFLGMNVMAAATGLVVPVPARQLDFLSTIHFMTNIADTLEALHGYDMGVNYDFIRVVASNYSRSADGEAGMLRILQQMCGTNMLTNPILASEEIKNSVQEFRSVYESDKPISSHKTFTRCRDNLDLVFSEILHVIRQQWPSTSMAGFGDGHLLDGEAA